MRSGTEIQDVGRRCLGVSIFLVSHLIFSFSWNVISGPQNNPLSQGFTQTHRHFQLSRRAQVCSFGALAAVWWDWFHPHLTFGKCVSHKAVNSPPTRWPLYYQLAVSADLLPCHPGSRKRERKGFYINTITPIAIMSLLHCIALVFNGMNLWEWNERTGQEGEWLCKMQIPPYKHTQVFVERVPSAWFGLEGESTCEMNKI